MPLIKTLVALIFGLGEALLLAPPVEGKKMFVLVLLIEVWLKVVP